jgi:hypothetical protein
LRWGVRVIAAYGHGTEQSVWLFSVPPDVFTESQAEQGGISLPLAGISSGTESGNRDGREVLFHPNHFSSPAYVERTEVNGQDLVDALTGIARIDIEIR